MTRKVLFDVDTGCDDALALLCALASDDLEVTGVTTVFGNTDQPRTTENTLSVLEFAGRTDVPVARGYDRPAVSTVDLSAPPDLANIHGEGGLTVDLPAADADPVDRHAVDLMLEQAHEHRGDLTIAAVGPLTNLATALAIEPDLPNIVDDIVVLAGAARALGNVTPAAGFNCYLDPEAAGRVFRDGSVTMVGMDVTERAPVSLADVERFGERGDPHRVMAELMDYYPRAALDRYGYPGPVVHDTLVAVELAEGVLGYEDHHVEVETGSGPARGETVCDLRDVRDAEANTRVALEVDADRYRAVLFDLLGGLAEDIAG